MMNWKTILAAIFYSVCGVLFMFFVMHISWTSGYMSRTLEETQKSLTSISESLDRTLKITDSMIGVNDDMVQSIENAIETLEETPGVSQPES